MKILLRDYFRTNERISLDVDLSEFGIADAPETAAPCGLSGILNDIPIGLFALRREIFLAWNGIVYRIGRGPICASFQQDGDQRTLRLHASKKDLRVEYRSTQCP